MLGRAVNEHRYLRRLVVAYNAFFWVTGPGMIGLGIWLFIATGEYDPVVKRIEFSSPAFIIISAGGASVLAGLLGCLGSLNENRCLLVFYSVLMFAVCAMEITATVFCFLLYDKADTKISSMLNTTITEYNLQNDIRQAWDSIQTELSCCGAMDYKDWLTTPFYTSRMLSPVHSHLRQVVPRSCCVSHDNTTDCTLGNAGEVILHPHELFQMGCRSALVSWLQDLYIIAGWAVAGVGATMILALSAVCCLKHAISGVYV